MPKVNCTTCHNGVNKPLNGANVIDAYPELAGPVAAATTVPTPAAPPEPKPQ